MAQSLVLASAAAPSPDALRAAHARLLADPALQFGFPAVRPESPPPSLPPWLQWVGHIAGWIFLAGVVLGLLVIAALILREALGADWAEIFRRRRKPPPSEWRPEPAAARALIADADRLAEAGAYDEAVRLILRRSIDDIDGRRPALVRPALTSREIAELGELPAAARSAFGAIAAVVERSLFGGRPVDKSGYAACRATYEAFALPGAWT